MPGDPDLDLDVDGATLVSVVPMGHEVWMKLAGGFGQWGGESPWEALPGSDESDETEIQIQVGYLEPPEWLFRQLVSQLEKWRDAATPLRLCCAPGRYSTLIEDSDSWVPLPRS